MSLGNLNGTYFGKTGDTLIDGMTNGYKWRLSGDKVIDWSISDGWKGEFWTKPSSAVLHLQMAFDSIEKFIAADFEFVGYFYDPFDALTGGSDINISLDANFIYFNSTTQWAIGHFPDPYDAARGDIYINVNSAANSLASYEPGSAGFFLALHEIGHTLGLKHPHDDGGTGRPTFSNVGWGEFDSDLFTFMSYEDDMNYNYVSYDPATPMVLDVLALQYLYGKNQSTNSGNSEHRLSDNNLYDTLYDCSGNDTINQARASEGWYVVLPDVFLTELVDTRVGVCLSMKNASRETPDDLTWLAGDFENAKGSKYSDALYGNLFNNSLLGNGGNDALHGNGGKDKVLGGAGNDKLFGGENNDLLKGDQGRDRVQGDRGKDKMFGGADADIFVFTKISDSTAKVSNADRIGDFKHGVDRIDLESIDASSVLSGNNAFTFDGTKAFGTSKQGEISYKKFDLAGTSEDHTIVYVDTDSDRKAEMTIYLDGLVNLSAEDFIL